MSKEIKDEERKLQKEKVRIETDLELQSGEKEQIEAKLAEIDQKVYKDTISQHSEKHKLDSMIEDIDKDIEELMRVLERKKKERNMLVLEKEVHEKKIEQARMKYGDEIAEHQGEMEAVTAILDDLGRSNGALQESFKALEEQRSDFSQCKSVYAEESQQLKTLKGYLRKASSNIDRKNKLKREMRAK